MLYQNHKFPFPYRVLQTLLPAQEVKERKTVRVMGIFKKMEHRSEPCIPYIINNIEGKITECRLVNEKSIFSKYNLLSEEGKITRSRLSSNSLLNQEVIFLQQWHLVSRLLMGIY